MNSYKVYYFSKWTFFITGVFIVSFSSGLIYFSLQFYPGAWQYSLLLLSPLLLFLYILPEYIRTLYFLTAQKPALILTELELIDNVKSRQYKWFEIERIYLKINEGKAPGSHIALHLKNSEEVTYIQDIKLKGKKFEILDELIDFHKRYGKQQKKDSTN